MADKIRQALKSMIGGKAYLPVDKVYEILPEFINGFSFEILSKIDMDGDHGKTYPSKKLIMIREDIYINACQGKGRDRFTMAHELGHLFLHQNIQFSRIEPGTNVPVYRNSEWQADVFASGLLIDEAGLSECRSIADVMTKFGVTASAAKCRFKN